MSLNSINAYVNEMISSNREQSPEHITMHNNIHVITEEELLELDNITYEDLEKELLGVLAC